MSYHGSETENEVETDSGLSQNETEEESSPPPQYQGIPTYFVPLGQNVQFAAGPPPQAYFVPSEQYEQFAAGPPPQYQGTPAYFVPLAQHDQFAAIREELDRSAELHHTTTALALESRRELAALKLDIQRALSEIRVDFTNRLAALIQDLRRTQCCYHRQICRGQGRGYMPAYPMPGRSHGLAAPWNSNERERDPRENTPTRRIDPETEVEAFAAALTERLEALERTIAAQEEDEDEEEGASSN